MKKIVCYAVGIKLYWFPPVFTDEGQFSSRGELILQISGINDYVLYICPAVFIALVANALCWSSTKQKFKLVDPLWTILVQIREHLLFKPIE